MKKEIKEKFTDQFFMSTRGRNDIRINEIEKFLNQEKENYQKELVEKIEKVKKKCKIIDYEENGKPVEEYFCQTYNKAISKILKLLKEK